MAKFKVGDKVKYVNDSGDEYFGEVLKADHQSDLIVGLKGYNGHSCAVTYPDLINYIQQKGYVGRCVHLESTKLKLAEEKKMETIFELKMGRHVVETRNGYRYLLVKQEGDTIVGLNLNSSTAYVTLILDENLQDIEDHEFDIKRVYEYEDCGFSNIKEELSDPVWERKEVKEMTMKEICDVLGCEVKIKKED